jgi:hypothetical protein
VKGKDPKFDEIESSLSSHTVTLGGVGEGHVQGKGKWRGCLNDFTVKYTVHGLTEETWVSKRVSKMIFIMNNR